MSEPIVVPPDCGDPDRYIAKVIYERWRQTPEGRVSPFIDALRYLGVRDLNKRLFLRLWAEGFNVEQTIA